MKAIILCSKCGKDLHLFEPQNYGNQSVEHFVCPLTLLEKIRTDYEKKLEANWTREGEKKRESILATQWSQTQQQHVRDAVQKLKTEPIRGVPFNPSTQFPFKCQ